MPKKRPLLERVWTAKAGEVIPVGQQHPSMPMVVDTVAPKCETNHGNWHCTTHGYRTQNNIDKDCHISKGQHRMVWLCLVHGQFEEP